MYFNLAHVDNESVTLSMERVEGVIGVYANGLKILYITEDGTLDLCTKWVDELEELGFEINDDRTGVRVEYEI